MSKISFFVFYYLGLFLGHHKYAYGLTCYEETLMQSRIGNPMYTVDGCTKCEVSDFFLSFSFFYGLKSLNYNLQMTQIVDVKSSNQVIQEEFTCSTEKYNVTETSSTMEILTTKRHLIVKYCSCLTYKFVIVCLLGLFSFISSISFSSKTDAIVWVHLDKHVTLTLIFLPASHQDLSLVKSTWAN